MIRIFIVGTGNLGAHLCQWFDAGGRDAFIEPGNELIHGSRWVHGKSIEQDDGKPVNVNQNDGGNDAVSAFAKARTPQKSRKYNLVGYFNKNGASLDRVIAPRAETYNDIPPADLILIAVPDDKVSEVSGKLPKTDAVVAHTSGSVPMNALARHKNHGVFYLPQSFSKSRTPDFTQIPVCVEFSNEKSKETLETATGFISGKTHFMDSSQRRQLHLAAVYMNNFVNHCYLKSQQILENAGIDQSVLNPLMKETLSKAIDLSPKNAQTGPAMRNDVKTIATHLELLPEEDRELYQTLTQSIQKEHLK